MSRVASISNHAADTYMAETTSTLQRSCDCGSAKGVEDQCPACAAKTRLGVQPKLKVNQPGDRYEQEADRIADRVVSTGSPGPVGMTRPGLQRMTEEEEELQTKPARLQRMEEEEDELQLKSTGGSPTNTAVTQAAAAISSGGAPLSSAERGYFEPRLGHDFSRVRLHDNARAGAAVRGINARAYTLKNHIAFAPGTRDFASTEGRRLMAHELVHTVQQHVSEPLSNQQLLQCAPPSAASTTNPSVELGRKLSDQVSTGLTIVFYDGDSDSEFRIRGHEIAKTERAIGSHRERITAKSLEVGISVDGAESDFPRIVRDIVAVSTTAVNDHRAATGGEPLKGDLKIANLVFLSHAGSGLCGLVSMGSSPKKVLSKIRDLLKRDVKIVLFACNTGEAAHEDLPKDSKKALLSEGGVPTAPGEGRSVAARTRDALIDVGKKDAVVYGNLGIAHPSKNRAKREFRASEGKGAVGHSFLGDVNRSIQKETYEYLTGGEYGALSVRQKTRLESYIGGQLVSAYHELINRHKADDRAGYERSRSLQLLDEVDRKAGLEAGQTQLAQHIPFRSDTVANLIRYYWFTAYLPRKETKISARVQKIAPVSP